VQFGHAGALARGNLETAVAKNAALKESFQRTFLSCNKIKRLYESLVNAGTLVPAPEPEAPKIPVD
jgi:ATP citrate (pro-S)-lyase